MRRVLPQAFLLFAGTLEAAHRRELAGPALELQQKLQPGSQGPSRPGVPVALRWITTPPLGFPRTPFEVWRRPQGQKPDKRLTDDAIAVSASSTVRTWTAGELYEVQFDAAPVPGATLTIDALDLHQHAIPGQRTVFATPARGAFRSPGIAALRVSGSGSVAGVAGATQNDVANGPGWERIQVVGLPFAAGEHDVPVYDPGAQGVEPPSLDGFDAAAMRLAIARMLRMPLPDTGVPDIPAPVWDGADPLRLLADLRDADPALVALIGRCLETADDGDPANLQVLFESDQLLDGISQADIPTASPGPDPATMGLPVVGVSMLLAGSDSESATALGYGTVDLCPEQEVFGTELVFPPDTVHTPFDYMVTAPYVVPIAGRLELAALAQVRAEPSPAEGLQAASVQPNRPPQRDLPSTESIRLSWLLSRLPQSYGVLRSRGPGDATILNAEREAGGFDPFVPQRPDPVDGEPPADVRTAFTDPVSPLPLDGVAVARYMAIGLDVFARWSPWRLVSYSARAGPVQTPGLLAVDLVTNVAARNGRRVPAKLVVEVAWDWSDRSPDRIELMGAFLPASGALPAAAPADVPFGPGGPAVVRFDAAGAPSLGSAHPGSVVEVPANPPDAERRRYKVTLDGVICDYTSASEVAFAVWARGAEKVRPAVAGPVTGPRVARAPDPIPPDPPALPAIDLIWTALPDATGRARAVLRWSAVPNAVGYIVWQATEAALRHAVDPAAAAPAASVTMLARAGALRQLVTRNAASQARSLIAFTRLVERQITATQLEIALPGAGDSLFAYRVSAITAANLESARSSSVALVAVPRRVIPPRPQLLLRVVPGGVDVIATLGRMPAPAGFQVHRVRRADLAAQVGMMGPPVLPASARAWRPVGVPRSPHASTSDPGRAITDPVPASWYAYHYRVVALGIADGPNGGLPGESDASAPASVVRPPAAAPGLDQLSVSANATNRLLRFRTDLPIRSSPLGRAMLAVTRVAAPAPGVRFERSRVLSIAAEDVAQGTLSLLQAPTAAQLAAMPEVRRSAPDATGRCVYTVRVRPDLAQGVVVATDPLGRSRELTIPAAT